MINPRDYKGVDADVPVNQHGQTGVLRDVADVMIQTEALHHRAGWDNTPPTLRSICRKGDGTYDLGVWRCGRLNMQPRDELALLAHLYENVAPSPGMLDDLYRYPLIGHMATFEAWGTSLAPDERLGRQIADIPGAIELRTTIAVVGRRHMLITRVRGKEPRFCRWTDGDTSIPPGGIHHSVVRIDRAARALLLGR